MAETRASPAPERWINAVNESIGRTVAWLFAAMVVLQLAIVVLPDPGGP